MIIVRRTSRRTVFSSSWSRREQAEKLGEWQNQTPNYKLRPILLKGVTAKAQSWGIYCSVIPVSHRRYIKEERTKRTGVRNKLRSKLRYRYSLLIVWKYKGFE